MNRKVLKSLLRERNETGRWYFAIAGYSGEHVLCVGVFTCDHKHAFYSGRSVASFKNRLFSLRDHNAPGLNLDAVSVTVAGHSTPVILRLDNHLEGDFRQKMLFMKRARYFVRLGTETQEEIRDELRIDLK